MEPARLTNEEYVEAVRREGGRLASAAESADLATPVPTCPGWDLAGLVRHLGLVHRWAEAMVAGRRTAPMNREDRHLLVGRAPEGDELLPWFREGLSKLVGTLAAAPPDLEVWAFLPAETPLGFWTRRQAQETLVHRSDVELAVGARTPIQAELAADGIDELLRGWVVDPPRPFVFERHGTLLVRPDDAEQRWLVRLGSGGVRVETAEADADCTLSGPAGALHLRLWNRNLPGLVAVSGDEALLSAWAGAVRI